MQNSFAQFESHIIQEIQHGLGQFLQVVSAQAEHTKSAYGDMIGTSQRIPLDFEWNGFIQRNNTILIDPSAPPRTISQISFPNQNHRATQPLISGSLERKGKIMRSYETNYYVITPSKFLHEFKTDDDFAKDPVPEMSLYLPDCMIGAVNGQKFNVKGKDSSKGKIGGAFSMSHEIQFKAHTPQAANQWWEVIRSAAGTVTNEQPDSVPTSPVTAQTGVASTAPIAYTDEKQPAPIQTQGVQNTGTAVVDHADPGSAVAPGTAATTNVPVSATSTTAPASAVTPASAVPGEPGKY